MMARAVIGILVYSFRALSAGHSESFLTFRASRLYISSPIWSTFRAVPASKRFILSPLPQIIRAHVGMMARAGIGILVYSWWGRPDHSNGDANGPPPDEKVNTSISSY